MLFRILFRDIFIPVFICDSEVKYVGTIIDNLAATLH
jgi:hypothetical protein